jgi:hypothetical protein
MLYNRPVALCGCFAAFVLGGGTSKPVEIA